MPTTENRAQKFDASLKPIVYFYVVYLLVVRVRMCLVALLKVVLMLVVNALQTMEMFFSRSWRMTWAELTVFLIGLPLHPLEFFALVIHHTKRKRCFFLQEFILVFNFLGNDL